MCTHMCTLANAYTCMHTTHMRAHMHTYIINTFTILRGHDGYQFGSIWNQVKNIFSKGPWRNILEE